MDPGTNKQGDDGEKVYTAAGGGTGSGRPLTPKGRRGRLGRPPGPPRSPRSPSKVDRSPSTSPRGDSRFLGRLGNTDLDPYFMPIFDPWDDGNRPWTEEFYTTLITRLTEALSEPSSHEGLLEAIDPSGRLLQAIKDLRDEGAKVAWDKLLERVDFYVKGRIQYIGMLGQANKTLTSVREENEQNKNKLEGLRQSAISTDRYIDGLEYDIANNQKEWEAKLEKLTKELNEYRQKTSMHHTQGESAKRRASRKGTSESQAVQDLRLEFEKAEAEMEERLQGEKLEFGREKAKLQLELEKAQREKAALERKLEQLKEQKKVLQQGLDDASKTGSTSSSTEGSAIYELNKAQFSHELERKRLKEKITDLQGRLATNEDELKNQQAKDQKSFEAQLVKIRQDHSQELSQLEAEHTQEREALEKQIAQLQSEQPPELQDLRAQFAEEIETYKTQNFELTFELEASKSNIALLSAKVSQLSSDLGAAKASDAELNGRLAQLTSTLEASTANNTELTKTVTLLTTELESSNASNAELNDRLGELTSALAASNTSNAELTAQVAPLSAELNASEARNNKLSGEIAQLKAKLEALRANSEGDAELADRLAKLESDLEESNARNIQLSGQLAAVEFQLANATSERDDTNERSHDVQERLEKIQRRLASLEQESESPMHSPEVQRAIWAAAAHEALNRLTELVSGLSAPRVPLPPSKSTGDGASSSAKGSPQTSSERKASSKIPLPSKRGARGGRGGRGRNRRDPPSGSSSSSSFVREPQSTTKRRTKSPVSSATSQAQVQLLPTRYDPTSGYPQTMLQVLFDNEVAVMDREVAGLRATRSSSEPDFLGRIRDLQRRAEELRGYNSTNTVVNETLAEATKVLELLGGKLPAGDLQDDEERRECLISTLGVIDILKETATARGATQDDQANAVAEAVPQLDNILLKLTAIDRRGPVGQEVSDLGSALRRWSSTPDTDQPSFKDLEGLLYQFQQNLEVLLIQNQQEFPHDTRDVTLIERKLQALNQEMVEAQQVAEEYREYKEENGDKAVEDGPRDKLISLAIEVIENNEWTRPTALETLLQTAAEFIPGHTNMEKWRATIQKYLERFWQEIAKLDRKTGRFDELLAETQEHIENDKVLRNLAKLERHKAFLQQVKQRLHQALAEWETGSLRPLQEFVNNEAREADQRAQDLLTTLLLEAKATLKKPDSPSKEEGRQTVSTQEGGTQTSAPPARVDANTQTTAPARVDANTQTTAPTQTPPTPNPLNVANPHLDGVCFCTILQYILPGVYHRIVNGGCCSNGLMKNPTTDGKRSGTQPPRSTDTDGSTAATTAAVTCSGHHGHGRLAASGDFYTILCNIFTALIWFTALILYSPYDFALYGLSLAAILLTPVTLIWRYLKWFYACANYKFFEQGNELEAVRPPTDPRAHPTAKGPNGRPLYAPPKRLGYPGIALPAVPAPGRLVSFAIITWTVYVTLVYIATYYERLIWLGANDYTGGSSRFGVREYTRELIGGGGLRMVPYADWSVYSVDWRFLGDAVGDIWLVRWVHGLFYDTGMGALGVEYLDDLPRPSERQAGWFGKWD